ncbi:MAG: RagB/SusD family nutrient uptake outer membrane protein [Prevotella sp.]|jgi:hypothetical protein|nr:RagB/SusD family nutrient uptake outer membrane protein [Prevotella sp.]
MKNLIYKIFKAFCISGFIFTASCNTFESEPLDWNTEDKVMNPKDSTASNIKNMFYAIYIDLPTLHIRLQDSYLDAGTDDGVPTKDKGGKGSVENYRNGSLSPDNISSLDGNAWARCYSGIRKANLFLQKIEGYPSSTQLPAGHIVKMKAEARAVRAYYYFEMLKRWDGIPLVYDKVLDLDSDLDIPRSSRDECVEYILNEVSPDRPSSCFNDLYEAQSTVNSDNTGVYGRFNKGTILGMLSRLRLYLASPLYNESGDVAKWKDAADAAKALIDLNVYDLFPDFIKLFADKSSFPSKEIIMVKQMGENYTIETKNSPAGYYNGTVKCEGLTSPSQNLVDAFLTIDGKTIDDPASGYDPQRPYENRDPRLTHTVFYNGSRWLSRNVETFEGGMDRNNRPGMIQTQTGYYLRKFLSASENRTDFGNVPHHFQIIRYAEILLNYAEALNEIDPVTNKAEIDRYLIKIRARAGINAGTNGRYGLPESYTREEMRTIIRNERRIELAFEDHRFWDIRRWKIAGDVMKKTVRGVKITKQADGSFKYEYVDVRSSTFDPKMYWYPIPREEMQGNSKLVQNPGWNY